MTGTTVDGVHGGVHRCGDYATRFDFAEDYVAADRFMREWIGDSGPTQVRLPISEVLGLETHGRMTGYYHDPASSGQVRSVDFTGGEIFASYSRGADGSLRLRTMYVEPVRRDPRQSDGTEPWPPR